MVSSEHNCKWISLCLFMSLAFVVCQVFSFLSMPTEEGGNGIFRTTTGNISDKYFVEITPANWAFAIWGIIYIFNIGWLVYLLVAILRKNKDGPVYRNPENVGYFFMIVYSLNLFLNASWLLLWDRELLEVALFFLVIISVTLYICLFDYHIRMNRNAKYLHNEHKVDLFLWRLLLQNGISIYATWCTIATLLNLTIVLVYRIGMSQTAACCMALSILAVELIVFFILDQWLFERYLRYTFTTYLTVIWALGASLLNNYDSTRPHSILSVILFAAAIAFLLVKIIAVIVRAKYRPLYVAEVELNKA